MLSWLRTQHTAHALFLDENSSGPKRMDDVLLQPKTDVGIVFFAAINAFGCGSRRKIQCSADAKSTPCEAVPCIAWFFLVNHNPYRVSAITDLG